MGIVYEAVETELPRRVALKVLPRAAALDARHRTRFEYEAQTTARLQHAHIVPVYNVGCYDGLHYYAMKYVDGCSLAGVIDHMWNAAAAGGNAMSWDFGYSE
jgi:serine/threonine protein kinase